MQDEDGGGVAGVRVALAQASGLHSGYVSSALTDARGKFVAEVFAGESQRAQLFPLEGCGYWIGESGATFSQALGREFSFDSSSESPLNLRVHTEFCRKVEGTVVSPEFGPLQGIHVWILDRGDTWRQSQRTSGDGSFALSVPRDGSYRIGVALSDGCSVYHRRGEPAGDWYRATDVRVSDSDISGIQVQIPSEACP